MHGAACELIIFDLDGTLVDTLPPTLRCFQEALAPALGRVPSIEEIRDRFGPSEPDIFTSWVGEREAPAAVARLYACYERLYHEMGPFPGVRELLADLRTAGRKTALFTGRGRPSTDVLLHAMELGALFDTTVTGEEAPLPKPAPDGVRMILERLSVPPSRAVLVGDSPLDLAAARAAGVLPIVCLWDGHHPEVARVEAGDLLVVRSVEELRAVLLEEESGT
jgi:HAD superfamily hydrolase (TIGR01509 family)